MKKVIQGISESLKGIEENFNYESEDSRDYSLRVSTSTFAGGFSEYLIHDLCVQVCENCKIDKKDESNHHELVCQILHAGGKTEILLNDQIETNQPDIDIHIGRDCALLLKNSRIDSTEVSKIWKEIQLCERNGIKRVYYGINFMKNIGGIDYIHDCFQEIRIKHSKVAIAPMDIKDIIEILFNELGKSGKKFLRMSQRDIFKILDY